MIGRNAGIGFDFFGLNARLSRTFALTERVSLEGIAEAFNALNHRNDMIPNGTWGTEPIHHSERFLRTSDSSRGRAERSAGRKDQFLVKNGREV